MEKLRIIFMGTPDFAVASLEALVEHDYNIVGVITAPDKPAGVKSYRDLITFVKDRPGHDARYAVDASKIERELGWVPEITVQEMCAEMVASDLNDARRHALLKANGFDTPISHED